MAEESGARTSRAVLVQCTKAKRDGCHKAKNLYQPSNYFRKQAIYADAVADKWFIQSAKYGLLHPHEVVEAYDEHAGDLEEPEKWAKKIAHQLSGEVSAPATVEILGGADYADPLTPELERLGFEVLEPLRGLGIGARMARLKEMGNRKLEGFA